MEKAWLKGQSSKYIATGEIKRKMEERRVFWHLSNEEEKK